MVTYDYSNMTPQTYTVLVNVSNEINFTDFSIEITVLRKMESISLDMVEDLTNVIRNNDTHWKLNLGQPDPYACYFVDFDDPDNGKNYYIY